MARLEYFWAFVAPFKEERGKTAEIWTLLLRSFLAYLEKMK